MDIGGGLLDIFGPHGEMGILLFVFLIFFIDALVFPTLPELFFIIGFMYKPDFVFGCELLVIAAIAEVAGISLLYFIVERIRVPERIKKVADKYVNFLIVSDERMLLVNRVAPMIPFAGAFISIVETWRLNRALFYVVLGCVLKYGAIMVMSGFFYEYFVNDAQTYTLIFIFAVIIISFMFAIVKKKRSGLSENN